MRVDAHRRYSPRLGYQGWILFAGRLSAAIMLPSLSAASTVITAFTTSDSQKKKKKCEYLTWVFTVFFLLLETTPKCHIAFMMLNRSIFKGLIQPCCRRVFWWFHEVSCWYFNGKTLMFTAVAILLIISALQSESRDMVAFNSFVSIFQTQGFSFHTKKRQNVLVLTGNCSKPHDPPLEFYAITTLNVT